MYWTSMMIMMMMMCWNCIIIVMCWNRTGDPVKQPWCWRWRRRTNVSSDSFWMQWVWKMPVSWSTYRQERVTLPFTWRRASKVFPRSWREACWRCWSSLVVSCYGIQSAQYTSQNAPKLCRGSKIPYRVHSTSQCSNYFTYFSKDECLKSSVFAIVQSIQKITQSAQSSWHFPNHFMKGQRRPCKEPEHKMFEELGKQVKLIFEERLSWRPGGRALPLNGGDRGLLPAIFSRAIPVIYNWYSSGCDISPFNLPTIPTCPPPLPVAPFCSEWYRLTAADPHHQPYLFLLLLLRSPAISLGFTIFGWDFWVCDRFF